MESESVCEWYCGCSHCPEEWAKPWLAGPLGKKLRWRSLLNCVRTQEFLGPQLCRARAGLCKSYPRKLGLLGSSQNTAWKHRDCLSDASTSNQHTRALSTLLIVLHSRTPQRHTHSSPTPNKSRHCKDLHRATHPKQLPLARSTAPKAHAGTTIQQRKRRHPRHHLCGSHNTPHNCAHHTETGRAHWATRLCL